MKQIVMMDPADLTPYENNPRDNEGAVEAVANSIREFGFKAPIIVDRDHVIIAGHTRLKAALSLGLKEVPVIVADDLTEEQAKLARRYVEDIYICYDGDAAGQNATLRGLEILKSHGLKVRVISLPNGEDPDEIIEDLKQALDKA